MTEGEEDKVEEVALAMKTDLRRAPTASPRTHGRTLLVAHRLNS